MLIYNAELWTLNNDEVIENGWLWIQNGYIRSLGKGSPPPEALSGEAIDANGQIVMPGLVDCHCHLMEYATSEVHKTLGASQSMAATANLLTALQCGITSLGEHNLGHPALSMPMEEYESLRDTLPIRIYLAFGCCQLGFEPPVCTSATRPKSAFSEEELTEDEYREMARRSDFAGENIFLNYTCANAPLEAVPHAGMVTYSKNNLRRIIDIFHEQGKKIGAHIENDDSTRLFLDCGGDVIHHGHNISLETMDMIADKGIPMVLTPAAGTSKRPTSPNEAWELYRRGVPLSIASDSYIPPHPEASWIDLPSGHLAGPKDFLKIAAETLRYLVEKGVSRSKALELITKNPAKLLRPDAPPAELVPGALGDVIICRRLPALETTDPEDVRGVVVSGQLVVFK
ncbi:amidohydrolase family protein [Clostridiaceae bacterium OttesenSCG-928-D20]|nr:amidohydrolase family protein [Clostridiaceae bacterium OttesenSCG-928-D20]